MRLKSNIPISKIDSYVNFAVRAGKVIWGLDNLERARKNPVVVLYDEALGVSSAKQLAAYCEKKQVKSLQVPANHLNDLLKRENVRVLSVTDESLGNAILANCE